MVHVVTGEIVAARARRAIEPHGAFEEPAWRVAHQEGCPARAAIGANGAEPFDVVQARDIRAVVLQIEADARQEHFVDEALEDRGKAHVPDRKGKDERVGFEQAVDIRTDAASIAGTS